LYEYICHPAQPKPVGRPPATRRDIKGALAAALATSLAHLLSLPGESALSHLMANAVDAALRRAGLLS
jgi:hypothetical protein